MKLECIGLLPATPSCVNSSLRPFETLVYDGDGNGRFEAGDFVLIGPQPAVNATLTVDPHIKYRDANNDNMWDGTEPIFYDTNNTVPGRIPLFNNPTRLTTLIKSDVNIRFVDTDNNGVLDGIVKITARLENVGGQLLDGTQEDVDAIQVIYTYNSSLMKIMRVSYTQQPPAPTLPDLSKFTKTVDTACTGSGGSPLDTVSPDETAGKISAASLCSQGPPRDPDVGIGCDPATRNATLPGVCPGDPATGGTTPLQNLDVVNVQFMVLARGSAQLKQVVDAFGVPGTKMRDIDGFVSTPVPVALMDTFFDNRLVDQPPVARFTFTPSKATAGEPVFFNATSSTDPDGTVTNYQWSFGDQGVATGASVSHTYGLPGNSTVIYTVSLTVTDNSGSTGTTRQNVTVNPALANQPPVARFTFTPAEPLTGQSVTFNASLSYDPDPGDMIAGYSWSFGDGVYSLVGPIVSHAYNNSGTYTVFLEVTDTHGATSSSTHPVFVTRIPYLPGVRVGDWAKYSVSGNASGVGNLLLATLNVTGVVGTNVTLVATGLFSNGTITSQPVSVDVRETSPFNLFLTAANLTGGDPPFPSALFPINRTISATFSGAIRQANVWSGPGFLNSVAVEWDQKSGILLASNETLAGQVSQTTLVETNIWPSTVNRPPVPVFTWTPLNPATGQTVYYNASRSYDPDPGDQITRYHWDFGDGTSANTTTPTHTYSANRTYTVTLTVTDNRGASASSFRSITVGAANQPPVASFTFAPTKPTAGQAVTFDASSSMDPDDTIILDTWNFGDGVSTVGVRASHTYTMEGTYMVTLTVTDSRGASGTLTRPVLVNPRIDQPPVASFTFIPASVIVGQPVSFDGRASMDPDGTVDAYSWNFGDGSPQATGDRPTHTYIHTGTFNVTLVVIDNGGVTGTTSKLVTVSLPPNQPPVAILTFSPANATIGRPESFDASASYDTDGTVTNYSWEFGDGTPTETGVRVSHTYIAPGRFPVSLIVTDDRGGTSSTTELVTVNALGTLKVLVRNTQASPVPGATVRITSGPPGQTLPPENSTGADGTVVFENLLPGNYTYQVTAPGFKSTTVTADVSPGIQPGAVRLSDATLSPVNRVTSPPEPQYTLYLGIGAAAALIIVAGILYLRRRTAGKLAST